MKAVVYYILLILLSASSFSHDDLSLSGAQQNKTVTDSRMTLKEALSGINIPSRIRKNLTLVDVNYYSFDGKLHAGQVLIRTDLAGEIEDIFREIQESRFPIARVIPIAKYNWSDSLSMANNNTSAFNYRLVKGTKIMSPHSTGRAIDINPIENPQIRNGKASPPGSKYDPKVPGTITPSSAVVKAFTRHGWKWGATWKSTKDYQHFEKK
ncbi:MAG TPA: M15 family metallopeptidase [Ignavibacteriales bacterium]|nr:M15 family metallopeptidase [Ignavibacteriales bacterium]